MEIIRYWKNKKVVVIGLGRSGCAAAALLKRQGAVVVATDKKPVEELAAAVSQLTALGVEVETGGHYAEILEATDLVVVSPGVPATEQFLQKVRERRIAIISELELGYWFCQGTLAAITGTNGKTTTTYLLDCILQEAAQSHVVAGNMGVAFTSVVEKVSANSIVVLEVSSFQLETIDHFRPRVAAILNITPDHLDRYPNMQAYVEAKARMMRQQTAQDILVLNSEDKYTPLLSTQAPGRVLTFSSRRPPEIEGTWIQEDKLCYRIFGLGQGELLLADELLIPGVHNLENALAAAAMALSLGVEPQNIVTALRKFRGVPHRLEPVGRVRGIRFINDSKGTNVDAVMKALQSYKAPVILILGGRDKQGDFTRLHPLLKEKARAVVVMGEAAEIIAEQINNIVQVIHMHTLEEAVRAAWNIASEGDIILFSPGCASFDQFANFEARGDAFRNIVKQLAGEMGVV